MCNLFSGADSATDPLTRVSYTSTTWADYISQLRTYRAVCVLLESTLKRHGYYCRSRRTGGSTTRPRSCIACARRKTGCDNKRPGCSRCMIKSIECQYPAPNTSRTTGAETGAGDQHNDDAHAEQGMEQMMPSLVRGSLDVDICQGAGNGGDITLDGPLVLPDPNFASIGGDHLEWDHSFTDFLNNTQTNHPRLSLGSSSLAHQSSPPSTDREFWLQQGFRSPSRSSIPTSPSSAVRSLIQRPNMQTGA